MHNKELGTLLLNCNRAGDKKKYFKDTLKDFLINNPEKEFNTEKIFNEKYIRWRTSLINVLAEIQCFHEIVGHDVSISADHTRFKLLRLIG